MYSANPAYSATHVYSAKLLGLEEGQLGEEPGGRREPGFLPQPQTMAAFVAVAGTNGRWNIF